MVQLTASQALAEASATTVSYLFKKKTKESIINYIVSEMPQSHKGKFKKRVSKKCMGKVLAAQVGDQGSDPQYPCVYTKLLCEQWLTYKPNPHSSRERQEDPRGSQTSLPS